VIEDFFAERGLYYRTNVFAARRPTLVLMHGVSGSSSAWRDYEARFENRGNLIAYDLRGHGKSLKYRRRRDYAIPCFVDDLRALLDHVGVDRCVLVCHSFAALIALEFLRAHQSRVDGAVIISGDFDVGRTRPARILDRVLAPVALLERLPSFSPSPRTHIDYAKYPQSGDWNVPRMLADIRNTTWRVYLYCTKEASAVHAEDLLQRILVPVLLVHGRRDSIFSFENSVVMAARIPDADIVLIDDADHIVVLNRPREVGDAIERYLRRLASRDGVDSAATTRGAASAGR
jgi:3-oxoadipate enol-lactonase